MGEDRRIRTFHIATYGCQMNLADSSTLTSIMTTRGYERVDNEDEADLLVFNTCSVREKAEERVLGRLGEIRSLLDKRPHVRVAVVGCMAQRLGAQLAEQMPHVNYVLGPDRLFELPDVVEGTEGARAVNTAFGHEKMDSILPVKETPYSGFVTISRGCDNYCTYCIVPYVRGPERAHSADYVVNSVRDMVEEGVVEIMLLGQNVNSYRHDGLDFPALLQRVAGETDIRRIRFMTSHPKDLSKKLVDVMAGEPKLMGHIHLPLQSGNNRVLEAMGRGYKIEHYFGIIDYIRSKLGEVSITTDLLVGFPSESEQEYEDTLAAVKRVGFDAAFMFRYSVRPGTAAADLVDDVPEAEKIRRLEKLIRLQKETGYEVNQKEVGQVRQCLVEGVSRRSDSVLRARTEGNKIVLFEAEGIRPGTVVPIRVTSADAFTLHGEPGEKV